MDNKTCNESDLVNILLKKWLYQPNLTSFGNTQASKMLKKFWITQNLQILQRLGDCAIS